MNAETIINNIVLWLTAGVIARIFYDAAAPFGNTYGIIAAIITGVTTIIVLGRVVDQELGVKTCN